MTSAIPGGIYIRDKRVRGSERGKKIGKEKEGGNVGYKRGKKQGFITNTQESTTLILMP